MGDARIILAGLVPMLVLTILVYRERRNRKARGERPPVQEKLLRLPGHTLSRQIEELWEGFIVFAIAAGVLSILLAIFLSQTAGKETTTGLLIFVLVFGLGAGVCTVMAWRKIIALRPLRLGLLGEQSVAEQLQSLLADGYRVFHDVPSDGKWNIDHVVVGPAGVFAIETKSRTKRPGKKGERDHEAVFDGKAIHFPWGYDTDALEQARRNARWLAGTLSKATGERVTAQPIVALPGWLVTLKANSDVKVLSGKQVPGFVAKEPARLPGKVIQQIAYQLDQRCRDVEF